MVVADRIVRRPPADPSSGACDMTSSCRHASATALALVIVMQPSYADSAGFAPHRAVYEITLLRAAAGSGISDMSGRMVYELTGSACEGFTQNMRFVTRSSNGEGAETVNDLRTSSWEEIEGKRLRFASTQYQNDKLVEASQGDGSHGKDERSASVALAKPLKKRVALPADIHFPMQHAAALIDSAKGGKTLFSAALYDGSEKGEKYYLTTAVIGKKVAPGTVADVAALNAADQLQGVSSWPMAISYFEAGKDKEDSLPSYELAFRYFENGVTSDLRIDYGAFALKGELKQLEMLAPVKCNSATP
jgi:EipB-like